jgi:hypothetical protein
VKNYSPGAGKEKGYRDGHRRKKMKLQGKTVKDSTTLVRAKQDGVHNAVCQLRSSSA